ncbi:hypothetical protein DL93DRAFT_1160799 [Clavulina sp. PMI_390]|nr:hypothetical protein DL93DRAFT_1160799 [Clavulina sp. PMI_390]
MSMPRQLWLRKAIGVVLWWATAYGPLGHAAIIVDSKVDTNPALQTTVLYGTTAIITTFDAAATVIPTRCTNFPGCTFQHLEVTNRQLRVTYQAIQPSSYIYPPAQSPWVWRAQMNTGLFHGHDGISIACTEPQLDLELLVPQIPNVTALVSNHQKPLASVTTSSIHEEVSLVPQSIACIQV